MNEHRPCHPRPPRLSCGVAALVVLALLCTGQLCLGAHTRPASFVVKVLPGRLEQVAATYTQRGYVIQQQNAKRGFLVVGEHTSSAATSAASPADSGQPVPGWVRLGPQQQPHSDDGSSDSSRDTAFYTNTGISRPVSGPSVAAAAAGGLQWQPQLPSYGLADHQLAAEPSTTAAAATAATAAAAHTAAVKQHLASIPGVQAVELNAYMSLLDRPLRPHTSFYHHQQQQQQQQHLRAGCSTRSIKAAAEAVGSPSSSSAPTCGEMLSYNPDLQVGRAAEGSPYGVSLVKADTDEMVQVSRNYRSKVMWCVIDTGLDKTNSEFDPATTSGCTPGAVRSDNSTHNCKHNWFEDHDSHGTHTSGSIGARRNGKGIVGVAAEGAYIYHYNIFGPEDSFPLTDAIAAWDDCLAEFDARKATTATPDMKMVVSMSFGGNTSISLMADALTQTANERSDVLFVAAAGNSGINDTSYPAGYPEVVSVAAVAWDTVVTDFSTFNDDVEWSGPGLGVLSTVPLWAAASSTYNSMVGLTISPAATNPDLFTNPPLLLMDGSTRGTVTAQVSDCGLANQTCTGAAGKICLIQRGGSTFCSKVLNCLAGGGIAAIVYNAEGEFQCTMLFSSISCPSSLQPPASGWPILVTAARAQGYALKELLSSNPELTVTLDTYSGDVALATLSGTSMACPVVAGVAGLVWSAHTNCTAADLRAAITATAKDLGPAGRDQYYGYGLVDALAAHNYLTANPCTPPPPPPPPVVVNCSGAWTWENCSLECGGGTQQAKFSVAVRARNGGASCEADAGATQSRPCNVQRCAVAVNDHVTAVAGQWTAVDVFANDRGDILDFTSPTQPGKGVARVSTTPSPSQSVNISDRGLSLGVVMYKSPAGFVGVDKFSYSIFGSDGLESTADVTVAVIAGNCTSNKCSPGGTCDAATGQCVCTDSSGMIAAFIPNPSAAAKKVTPQVPACRYNAFSPVGPFRLDLVVARRGSNVVMSFALGNSKKCASGQVVHAVSFARQAACPYNIIRNELQLAHSGMRVGRTSCKQGHYSHAFTAPSILGCYTMTIQLRDGSSETTLLKVT